MNVEFLIFICFLHYSGLVRSKAFSSFKNSSRVSSSVFSTTDNYLFPASELYALTALYHSTNGPEWIWHKPYDIYGIPWNFSQPSPNPCSERWQGVYCTTDCSIAPCFVEQLVLDYNYLQGTLPPEIGNFSAIVNLGLDNNVITGSIPAEIGQLTYLEYLYLDYNQFSGSLPLELTKLMNLIIFRADVNILSGSISPHFGNLSNLEQIYISQNRFTGTIPKELGNLEKLTDLNLGTNLLQGSIPIELGMLPKLELLLLSINLLSGSIPWELGNISSLVNLVIDTNRLTGSIPKELGRLQKVTSFLVYQNRITGTLPAELGNMTSLELMGVSNNYINGTIPMEFGHLYSLQTLYIAGTLVSGSIPSSLGNLKNVTGIFFYYNMLSGSIPSSIGNMTRLFGFYAELNKLSGSLPSEIGNLKNLSYLYLEYNRLVGTIPSSYESIDTLFDFSVSFNFLNGTIPSKMLQIQALHDFSVGNNQFSGNLSFLSCFHDSNVSASKLTTLNLNDNQFTGALPKDLNFPNLVQLQLQNNLLTGEVQLSNLTGIVNVDLSNNKFYGKLPSLSLLISLQYMNLSNNQFSGKLVHFPLNFASFDGSLNALTGTIGTSFKYLPNLQTISLQSNSFSGDISELIDPTLQTSIDYIDLSYNLLTGTLSSSLFTSKSLKTFVLTGNCITGSIPSTICEATNMTTLVLDGMGTNIICNKRLFPMTSSQSYISNTQSEPSSDNILPSCLFWQLSKLQTLHLSGLGMRGSLPSLSPPQQTLTKSLQYVSLSYNQLTGTIPAIFFSHYNWKELDLSFNQISGTFPVGSSNGSYGLSTSHTQLSLQLNRLSGVIPSQILELDNVNILNGNLFECPISGGGLPSHDSYAESYQCGSNEVDLIVYIWMGLLFLLFVVIEFMLITKYQNQVQMLRNFLLLREQQTNEVFVTMAVYALSALLVCLYSLIILIPVFVCLSVAYPVYTNQYAWTVSACFMKGFTPAVVLLAFFLLLQGMLFVGYVFKNSLKTANKDYYLRRLRLKTTLLSQETTLSESIDTTHAGESIDTFQTLPRAKRRRKPERVSYLGGIQFIGLVTCNIVLVLVANAVYVFAIQEHLRASYTTLIAIGLAGMKIISTRMLLKRSYVPSDTTTYVLISLLCFNNVVVPFLAESFVSTSCFYYATLSSAPMVSSTIEIVQTTLLVDPEVYNFQDVFYEYGHEYAYLLSPAFLQISYQPPFIYGYACGSALITDFASVFALRYLWSGLIMPVLQVCIDKLMRYMTMTAATAASSSATVSATVSASASANVSATVSASASASATATATTTDAATTSDSINNKKTLKNRVSKILFRFVQSFQHGRWRVIRRMQSGSEEETALLLENVQSILYFFDRRKFSATLVADVAVLLTFGVLFPPLAVLITVSIAVHICDYRLAIYELMKMSERTEKRWQRWLSALHTELSYIDDLLYRPLPLVAILAAAIWSLLLFDTLGARVGAEAASWIVGVMIFTPLIWYLVYWLWEYMTKRAGYYSQFKASVGGSEDIELSHSNNSQQSQLLRNPMLPDMHFIESRRDSASIN